MPRTISHAQGRQKQRRIGFFPPDNPKLFVPTEDMWIVRLNSPRGHFDTKASLIRGAADVAMQALGDDPKKLAKWGSGVSFGAIQGQLQRWRKAAPWLEGWLLRHESPPDGVKVATADLVRRCRKAWDPVAHCCAVKLNAYSTYWKWLVEKKYSLAQNVGLLKWLYGFPPPEDVFVLPEKLRVLRWTLTVEGIAETAGLWASTYQTWTRDPDSAAVLKDAIAAARWPAKLAGLTSDKVHPDRLAAIKRYAASSTFKESCKAAELSTSHYYALENKAEVVGAKEDLLRYLRRQKPYTDRQCGLFAGCFFVPTPEMWSYRKAARAAMVAGRLIRNDVWLESGFEEWFLAWTTPRKELGSRNGVTSFGTVPAPTHTPLPATETGSRKGKSGRPSLYHKHAEIAARMKRENPLIENPAIEEQMKADGLPLSTTKKKRQSMWNAIYRSSVWRKRA
jgi:hypothetical protein